uniref:Uncharacterized protein n=1 Tax=Magallana gigas TaxID=29159 RepID=A0A8W8N2S4_MAGGI
MATLLLYQFLKHFRQSCTISRTVEEIKKQYANIKQRAKEKADALRRPATGGGPKPPSPSPVEAEFLSGMGDRPTLSGLASGYDTEEVQIELVPEFNSDSNIVPSSIDTDTACTNAVNYQLIDLPVVTTSTGQRTSKRRKTMEDEEILTLQAEREKWHLDKLPRQLAQCGTHITNNSANGGGRYRRESVRNQRIKTASRQIPKGYQDLGNRIQW